jgi:hypothetical protein
MTSTSLLSSRNGKIYKDCFSRPALYALYRYLDELSSDIGEDIELDVVGICCEFAEYKDIDAVKEDYGFEVGEVKTMSELQETNHRYRI